MKVMNFIVSVVVRLFLLPALIRLLVGQKKQIFFGTFCRVKV